MVNYGERHEFLRSLHALLQPTTYLEIGVQRGYSLALAQPPTLALGIDPAPMIQVQLPPTTAVRQQTSDEFFADDAAWEPLGWPYFDLAFIDGMHLFEYALRDVINVQRHSRPDRRSVIVLDDVLPYSSDIAGRTPLPGDWTGDVWKVYLALTQVTSHLRCILVDVDPTGVLVVLGADPGNYAVADSYEILREIHMPDADVPKWMLRRDQQVYQPAAALDLIRKHLNITEA